MFTLHHGVQFGSKEREAGKEVEPIGRCVIEPGTAKWGAQSKGLHPGEALITRPWNHQGSGSRGRGRASVSPCSEVCPVLH